MHPAASMIATAPIEHVRVGAFTIPTDAPESDGTLDWHATTLVVTEVTADGQTGLGYTYADVAVARAIRDHFVDFLSGRDAFAIEGLWREMFARTRNLGRTGGVAMAVSAVDVALWDLKARLLSVPLVTLLGPARVVAPHEEAEASGAEKADGPGSSEPGYTEGNTEGSAWRGGAQGGGRVDGPGSPEPGYMGGDTERGARRGEGKGAQKVDGPGSHEPGYAERTGAELALTVYGSGGFTSYTDDQLREQFTGWAELGITRFKMKVGREPRRDHHRVRAARAVIGDRAELFVDANSAYTRNQALEYGQMFVEEADARWFEQPLPPEDLAGLRFLRERLPAQMEVADGEYGYDLDYFRRVLEADAIDVVMADVTRCGGITGFMKVAALAEARQRPLSSHCAPALHVHPGLAAAMMRHAEYFHDHARIERELFDGVVAPRGGALHPDLTRPGHGLAFKWSDAERYAV